MRKKKKVIKILLIIAVIFTGIFFGAVSIWTLTLQAPNFNGFENIKIAESTKIYDRTGEVLLYDVHGEVKRTFISFDEIPRNLKNAAIAIEDTNFYQHGGVNFFAVARAFLVNLKHGSIKQGGSTITQQLVKNTFLTPEQTVSRKIKELMLSFKIEQKYSKDEILGFYLNEIPFGSNNYGIEAASQSFFGKSAKNLTLAESAYLAALPKAPTYYSPYGERRDELEKRKNTILERMRSLNFISEKEYEQAKNKKVVFLSNKSKGIKAPHFVLFLRDELVKKYGEETVEKGGLKVITTLDFELQKTAEDVVSEYAKENEKKFNARNAGLAGIDPKTGQILVMVGSRDYFDEKNDGNYNITTAKRQPGSAFKPFVYATALKKGYTPDTVVFDLQTNFGTRGAEPYIPDNYDNIFRGPVTFRNALAQSINVPAVKVLYLAGIDNSIQTARDLGITTLVGKDRYGLSLVLGGGEVKPLEMAGAYGVFANDGRKNDLTGILEVRDGKGKILEKYEKKEKNVLDENIARMITDMLSDNAARAPAFGSESYLYFPERQVAAKTGTTNNYRDAWVVGYTPNFSLAVWAGNNDNTSMEKKVAGFIAAPMWNAFLKEVFKKFPAENFGNPDYSDKPEKPVLNGNWRGSKVYKGVPLTQIHSVLFWVDKNDPRGAIPENPASDPQFQNWEAQVRAWTARQGIKEDDEETKTRVIDEKSKEEFWPRAEVLEPKEETKIGRSGPVTITLEDKSHFSLKQLDFFFKDEYLGSLYGTESKIYKFTFDIDDFINIRPVEKIKIRIYDTAGNASEFERNIQFE